MALLKTDGYGNHLRVDTGDSQMDEEMKDQLGVTVKELIQAINAENLTDRIFARIMKWRTDAHRRLCEKIPGAKAEA